MKSVWHQQIKWRQQGVLFVFLFLLAASINVPLALQFRRINDMTPVPMADLLRDDEAAAMGWPSEIQEDKEWPPPIMWFRTSSLGYTKINAQAEDGFYMQLELVGLPLPVFECTWSRWKPTGSEEIIDTMIHPRFYALRWDGLIGNPLIVGAVSWLFLFLLFPGRVFMVEAVRRSRGKCIKCGYDLRGDFESGCSECGWNRKDNVEKSKHQNVKNKKCEVE